MKLTICFDDISLPAAADGGARHPPDGHRDGARHGGRGRAWTTCAGRRAGPAPPHDRGRAAPRPRRPGLRRVRPARPADPARRRGPRQPHLPGPDGPGRGRRDQQAGRHLGPAGLRQHQPRRHGRRAQERGHRPGQLPEPAPPPQPADHAPFEVVHGPDRPPSCTRPTGAWAGSSPTRASRSSRSRRR